MVKQIVFIVLLMITLSVFFYTLRKLVFFFKLTKPFPIKNIPERIKLVLKVAIGQTKIFRWPMVGFAHAMVFWGFLLILFGSIEMVVDGLFGIEKSLAFLGGFYSFISVSIDIFSYIVFAGIVFFLFRRIFLHIKRFTGIEMNKHAHLDALVALSMILFLMVSLIGMNVFYLVALRENAVGAYPISQFVSVPFNFLSAEHAETGYQIFWWMHIGLIFIFANLLPYSKHFHVFLSVPNVFLSRLEPVAKLPNMESVTKEVKIMMDPNLAYAEAPENTAPPERFGVKDVNDATWKNYMDSLTCTQCGRCTSVCPANMTGKKLSPRKIFIDFRARMNEKGNLLLKNGKDFDDNKSLLRNYISEEELWACTTCMACAEECPVNINHPSLIVDMRRYLVMEESSAPSEIKNMFSNVENNGAPWQFSPEDRLLWAKDLSYKLPSGESHEIEIPLYSEKVAAGKKPEYLFWVGCAGAFDDRFKKATRAFAKLLTYCKVDFGVLGAEESCTGDAARRAGNEMLFQMQAFSNIAILNGYQVDKIITMCPHCFNMFKNAYADFGGHYEVIHHTQFIDQLIKLGQLKVSQELFSKSNITYHDPCYLGRGNGEYASARNVIQSLSGKVIELDRSRSFSLCCGAGGAQMFKEAEKGNKEVFMERTNDVIKSQADIVASSCPFCMVMLTDGIKYNNKEESLKNYDVAELVVQVLGI